MLVEPERLTQPEIVQIAQRIPHNWRLIAGSTGIFTNEEITAILFDNFHFPTNVQKASKMLNDYVEKKGSRKKLVSALKVNGMDTLADCVEFKLLQGESYGH